MNSSLDWKHSPPHPEAIAYVEYENGCLIWIGYEPRTQDWLIELLNRTVSVTRAGQITEMERIKKLSEQLLRSLIKKIVVEFKIEI